MEDSFTYVNRLYEEAKLKQVKNEVLGTLSIVTRNGLSGNTGRFNRNLYVMLKFTERPKTPRMTSKKTLLSVKGISCLQVILC